MTGAQETVAEKRSSFGNRNIWIRGAFMLFFIAAFGIAQLLINLTALVQFLSLLFTGNRNATLVEFGTWLGRWLEQVAAFQSGASDEKPFPFE